MNLSRYSMHTLLKSFSTSFSAAFRLARGQIIQEALLKSVKKSFKNQIFRVSIQIHG